MAGLPGSIWAVVLAAPLPAAAQNVCAALARIEAAAHEPVPFASLSRALAAGETVVPGFEAGHCHVGKAAFYCGVRDMAVNHFDGWPRPLTCAGLLPATITSPPSRNDEWRWAYRLRGLRVEYGGNCWACRGGAYSFFSAGLSQ